MIGFLGKIIGSPLVWIFAAGLGWGEIRYHKGHDKGESDCQAAQIKADSDAVGKAGAVLPELKLADSSYSDGLNDRDKNYDEGITQNDLADQYNYGLLAGRAESRRAGLKDGLSKADACLALPYADDDKLRRSGRSLQGDIFGDSVGSDHAGAAAARLRGRELAGSAPLSYPQPD